MRSCQIVMSRNPVLVHRVWDDLSSVHIVADNAIQGTAATDQ